MESVFGGFLRAAAVGPYAGELFRASTARACLPEGPFQFAYLVIGRRGGKSFAMAITAVYLALFRDWKPYLSPGERAIVLLVAADREQAKILHRYIVGILRASPLLAQFLESETVFGLELAGGVAIEVATRSYRTVRGRSVAVALLDEIAFWRDEESANPDVAVVNAVRASQATFGDAAVLIAASSPYARRGVLWDAWRKFHGKDDASALVWQAATRAMNPTVSQSFIDAEFERDPISARAEYDATFRSDIEAFVSQEIVDACTFQGRYELSPSSSTRYVGFADPSGGSADSFTMAVAHREKDTVVIDAVREVRPPFSPDAVCEQFAALLKSYRIASVQGDNYAVEWPKERMQVHGIRYERCETPKSGLYQQLLPLLNSGRIELLENQRLIRQLCSLERRTTRGGRDIIDHPPGAGSHDDLVNSVAGAASILLNKARPLFISDEVVRRSSIPGGGFSYGKPVPAYFPNSAAPQQAPVVLQPDWAGSASAGDFKR